MAPLIMSACLQGASKRHEQIIKKYSLDPTLAKKLDAQSKELIKLIKPCSGKECTIKHPVWELPWLPGYLMKHDICRIEGMEKIRTCIDAFKLECITVPRKYLYHIPGMPEDLNDANYYVIVPKLTAKKTTSPITLSEIQQLHTIIKHTGYCDIQKSNILRLENNQLAIIDTESSAFCNEPYVGLMRFISYYGEFNIHEDFTNEAFEYIISELYTCMPLDKTTYREFYGKLRESLKRRPEFYARMRKILPKP